MECDFHPLRSEGTFFTPCFGKGIERKHITATYYPSSRIKTKCWPKEQ